MPVWPLISTTLPCTIFCSLHNVSNLFFPWGSLSFDNSPFSVVGIWHPCLRSGSAFSARLLRPSVVWAAGAASLHFRKPDCSLCKGIPVFLLLRWVTGHTYHHYTSIAPCSATCQQWGVLDETATGSCTDLAKDSPKFYPLEYLFGLLKLIPPPYTWIKL